jgi:hypothetical protein
LSEFFPHRIKANPIVKEFYSKLLKECPTEEYIGKEGADVSENPFSQFEYKEPEHENISEKSNIKIIKL